MARLSAIFILLVTVAGSVRPDPDRDAPAEFFAGILLLQSASGLTPERRAQKYRELQAITGISGAEAAALLKDFRDKPEEWKKMHARVMDILTDSVTFAKKIDGTAASKPKIQR